jgi:hypothetical protein
MAHAAPAAAGFRDCRNIWVQTLEHLAEADPRIVAVVNDSVGSSKLSSFQKKFPDRLINVGIAEQVMVGIGAGLANGGHIPFVSAASCFISGRALEQVKADIAYANYNVKLVGQSSGVAYGELGATHHSIEDFAWLRPLANLTVIVPADAWETAEAVKWAAAHEGPVYLRLSRMPVPDLDIPNRVFRPGSSALPGRRHHPYRLRHHGTSRRHSRRPAGRRRHHCAGAQLLNHQSARRRGTSRRRYNRRHRHRRGSQHPRRPWRRSRRIHRRASARPGRARRFSRFPANRLGRLALSRIRPFT